MNDFDSSGIDGPAIIEQHLAIVWQLVAETLPVAGAAIFDGRRYFSIGVIVMIQGTRNR